MVGIAMTSCPWTEALKLARRKVPTFPCDQDKRPLIPGGFKNASADPNVVHSFFMEYSDALIGVPTGDRFVVIDLDLQHEDAQQWYDTNHSRLPLTRTHITRSGGRHSLFKPNPQIGCSTGKLGPHVDSRGIGGYIIWWPAAGFHVLHGGVLALAPDWIVEALHPPEPPQNVVRFPIHLTSPQQFEGIVRTIARASEGERNSICYWGACRMRELVAQHAIERNTAIEIVVEAASRAGLPRQEARRTVLSAFRGGT
jgi:hypothetical protein